MYDNNQNIYNILGISVTAKTLIFEFFLDILMTCNLNIKSVLNLVYTQSYSKIHQSMKSSKFQKKLFYDFTTFFFNFY